MGGSGANETDLTIVAVGAGAWAGVGAAACVAIGVEDDEMFVGTAAADAPEGTGTEAVPGRAPATGPCRVALVGALLVLLTMDAAGFTGIACCC